MDQQIVLGILGVRDHKDKLYDNYEYVEDRLEEYLSHRKLTPQDVSIVTGGSRGSEKLVIQWAERHGVAVRCILPNIAQLGHQKAFTTRNIAVVTECDELLVFFDGTTELILRAIGVATCMAKSTTVYPLK